MTLIVLPVFATGEFNLNEEDGQCLISSSYVVEDKCFQADQYMITNYPELTYNDRQDVIAIMSDWNSFANVQEFYDIIDMFVLMLRNE